MNIFRLNHAWGKVTHMQEDDGWAAPYIDSEAVLAFPVLGIQHPGLGSSRVGVADLIVGLRVRSG